MLLVVKLIEAVMANPILEKRYFLWLSNRKIEHGLNPLRTLASAGFVLLVLTVSVLGFAFPGKFNLLNEFPTTNSIRLTAISWVERLFDIMTEKGDWIFTVITRGIRWVLDGLELIFVGTPWIVVASFIILLTALSAGRRAAIFAGAFLAYMGFLGFWEKAMTTLALLGTAAMLSIVIGIPLGLFCARRPRLYSFIRPIMDFMQTMPAFVFMIRHRKTRSGSHHHDFWRHARSPFYRLGFTRSTRVYPRSCHFIWRIQMVFTEKSGSTTRCAIDTGGDQSNDHA